MKPLIVAAYATALAGGLLIGVSLGAPDHLNLIPSSEEVPVTLEPTTTTTTGKPVETVPTTVLVTLAPGFEAYRPGDDLPVRAPAPRSGEDVQTVDGPHGPIYPDGYTDPEVVSPPQRPPTTAAEPRADQSLRGT